MSDSQRGFELLHAGDADVLRRLLEQDPAASEAHDSAGVSLLMHSLYRGRRDLAELIASRKKALDIFEATSLGLSIASSSASATLPSSTPARKTASRPCISPVFSDSPSPPVC